jgi:iron-sulfur cluster assembly protein
MIILTDSAIKQITDQLAKRGSGLGIRFGVKQTGCSGYSYILEFVDQLDNNDQETKFDKFSVFIDDKSLPYLKDMVVDFVKEGIQEGFNFVNPNSKSECGCGESFTV